MVNDPFRALSHPIRRGIVPPAARRLPGGNCRLRRLEAGDLEAPEGAGGDVVTRTVEGRTHRLSLEPDALGEAVAWMERQRVLWARMFDVVDEYLKEERAK